MNGFQHNLKPHHSDDLVRIKPIPIPLYDFQQ